MSEMPCGGDAYRPWSDFATQDCQGCANRAPWSYSKHVDASTSEVWGKCTGLDGYLFAAVAGIVLEGGR